MIKPLRIAVAIAIAQLGGMYAPASYAGGTSFTEQGASGLGNSYAGLSSAAEDATVQYWNPAALTRFKRAELVGGLLAAQLFTPYTNSNTPPCEYPANPDTVKQACAGGQGSGPTSGTPGKVYERDKPARVAIPFNAFAMPMNDRLVIGGMVSGSSGLVVRYPSDSPGRTSAESTDLKVVRISGGAGYKVTPTISLGASLGYERMFTSIKARLNYRAAVANSLAANPNPINNIVGGSAAQAFVNDDTDAETSIKIRVFGWAINGQVGGLWEPSEKTRVGVGFRPKTKFMNQGYLDIQNIPANVTALGTAGFLSTEQAALLKNRQEVRQNITLPSEFNVSVFHSLTPKLDVMASYLREDFTDTEIDFRTLDNVVIQKPRQRFQVTQRYALGGNYKVAKRLMLRAGLAKENSAIGDEDRLQSLPDNDRKFFNVGARFIIDKSAFLDVGYQRIDFADAQVGLNPQPTDVGYNGRIKVKVDIIGIQLVDQF
ncbi:MAG: outer membrane protein transport protein [Burkholderiales bacterium]|nr:outer membrane protein transport protein [Burkholderiales bacterium]